MKEDQKELGKEKTSPEDNSKEELFTYEVSSTSSKLELIEELSEDDESEELKEQLFEEKQAVTSISPKKLIRIISEKDMEIKENPPPNYSPYFVCALHFKNQPYKKRRVLMLKQLEET
ncbi:MAG: hypothetical protein JXA54_16970 [Candidatus Heimdallarchaeota archaeon]|nr:hypothetical protein [Candidatus Heimdallarchaeota archaeon]